MTADTPTRQRVLRPLFDRIVVKELDPDDVRRSGLIVPLTTEEHRRPPHHGIVLAVGPGLEWWESVQGPRTRNPEVAAPVTQVEPLGEGG